MDEISTLAHDEPPGRGSPRPPRPSAFVPAAGSRTRLLQPILGLSALSSSLSWQDRMATETADESGEGGRLDRFAPCAAAPLLAIGALGDGRSLRTLDARVSRAAPPSGVGIQGRGKVFHSRVNRHRDYGPAASQTGGDPQRRRYVRSRGGAGEYAFMPGEAASGRHRFLGRYRLDLVRERWGPERYNAAPVPSILCDPLAPPDNTADSSGSTATMCNALS